MPFEKASFAAFIGGTSGQKMDKFQRLNIEREKPLRTKAPILKDAYAAYECKLVDNKLYGDHIWVVGEIVAVHFFEEAFTSEGILDLNRIKPLLYLGSELYATADKGSLLFLKRGE
jgi:flavin reductase (DIM6/NTAB) family NADH-FMN oxidoreductase RutF